MSSYSSSPSNAASAGRGLSPLKATQSGLDYLAEAATSVSTVDWDVDGREVRPITRLQQQASAIPVSYTHLTLPTKRIV